MLALEEERVRDLPARALLELELDADDRLHVPREAICLDPPGLRQRLRALVDRAAATPLLVKFHRPRRGCVKRQSLERRLRRRTELSKLFLDIPHLEH